MSIEELKKAIEEMKAQGQSEEEIAGAFYLLFRDGKINLEQLEALVNVLGFELNEEFKAMDPEQQKEAGYEVLDENPEKHEQVSEEDNEEPSQKETEAEEDEEGKAMKLLGQNKKDKKEETSNENEDEEEKAMKFFR